MPLDPEAMLVFASLAREGGVRGAARALAMPRSTVSRKLAELEASVGSPLVVRTSRRFALTNLGTALAARCNDLEEVVRASEDLVGRAAAEPSGTLHVAMAPVLGEEILPAVLAELVRRHPRLSVDASLAVEYVDLRKSRVDVAVRTGPLDDASDLYAVRLGTSVSGCYASAAYLSACGKPKKPADLAEHECIVVGPHRTWRFRDQKVKVRGRIHVDNFRVARDVAARGAGIVRVAHTFAEPLLLRGDLVPLLEPFWLEATIFAVHAGSNPPEPRVRAFIDAARAAVARALPPPPTPPRWRSA